VAANSLSYQTSGGTKRFTETNRPPINNSDFLVIFFSNTPSVLYSVTGSRVRLIFLIPQAAACFLTISFLLHMDPGTTVLGKPLVHIDGLSSSFTICLSFVWVAIWKFCGWFSLDVLGISSLVCCFVFHHPGCRLFFI